MEIVRVNVPLTREESEALMALARRVRRHPRQQAALMLRRDLERRGLLGPNRSESESAPAGGGGRPAATRG